MAGAGMIGWVRQKLAQRRAKKEAADALRRLTVRKRVMAQLPEQPVMTPTAAYETVKKSMDVATEQKKHAREAAQKILRNNPSKK
jgi:hypothetical protein